MSSLDWTFLTNVLSAGNVARGVTTGPVKPNGGGTFVYGMHSLTATVGVVGLYATPQAPNTNFNPMPKGCDMSMALKRAPSGGALGYAPFLFALASGTDAAADTAYVLGLSDGNPSHIELRKGAISLGLPDEAPNPTGSNHVISRSTAEVAVDEWVHLRLEVAVNTFGDVVINVYRNDLLANSVSSPVWAAVAGMAQFTDDALGVNTGLLPYTSGRAGFAARFSEVGRRCYFDHARLIRQV